MSMGDTVSLQNRERAGLAPVRGFANQAFSRAAGASLIGGNRIRLLIDARESECLTRRRSLFPARQIWRM
jgi:hypothetical protein